MRSNLVVMPTPAFDHDLRIDSVSEPLHREVVPLRRTVFHWIYLWSARHWQARPVSCFSVGVAITTRVYLFGLKVESNLRLRAIRGNRTRPSQLMTKASSAGSPDGFSDVTNYRFAMTTSLRDGGHKSSLYAAAAAFRKII